MPLLLQWNPVYLAMTNNTGKRIILIFTIIIISTGYIRADNQRLLLYANDVTFLPQIEDILSRLRNRDNNNRLFSEIVNLNKWSINRYDVNQLENLIRLYESPGMLRRKSDLSVKEDSATATLIRQCTSYIRIDVLTKLPLIEFQLIVSDSLPPTKSLNEYPTIINASSRYVGFIVDISRGEISTQLENSLKRIFPISNHPPNYIVKSNNPMRSNNTFYIIRGQRVFLDASQSYDYDTPWASLSYKWRQLNPAGTNLPLDPEEIVTIEQTGKRIEFVPRNSDAYCFALTITDGIASSKEVLYHVLVVPPPATFAVKVLNVKGTSLLFNKPEIRIPFAIYSKPDCDVSVKIADVHARPGRPLGPVEQMLFSTIQWESIFHIKFLQLRLQSDTIQLVGFRGSLFNPFAPPKAIFRPSPEGKFIIRQYAVTSDLSVIPFIGDYDIGILAYNDSISTDTCFFSIRIKIVSPLMLGYQIGVLRIPSHNESNSALFYGGYMGVEYALRDKLRLEIGLNVNTINWSAPKVSWTEQYRQFGFIGLGYDWFSAAILLNTLPGPHGYDIGIKFGSVLHGRVPLVMHFSYFPSRDAYFISLAFDFRDLFSLSYIPG